MLQFVQPLTVIAWQRRRFREHWARISRHGPPGRPAVSKEIQDLIRRISRANPGWGSPRIVGELGKLGIEVAKSTVEKYRIRSSKPPSPTWRAFLKNRVADLVSIDLFTIPTLNFKVLFVLVVLSHHRRRVFHFNVTENPTAQRAAQQMVEAFPWDSAPKYLLRDRDAIYGEAFHRRVASLGIDEVLSAPRSPWQNPEECLNRMIFIGQASLRRAVSEFMEHYHEERNHQGLENRLIRGCPCVVMDHGRVHRRQKLGGMLNFYYR